MDDTTRMQLIAGMLKRNPFRFCETEPNKLYKFIECISYKNISLDSYCFSVWHHNPDTRKCFEQRTYFSFFELGQLSPLDERDLERKLKEFGLLT